MRQRRLKLVKGEDGENKKDSPLEKLIDRLVELNWKGLECDGYLTILLSEGGLYLESDMTNYEIIVTLEKCKISLLEES